MRSLQDYRKIYRDIATKLNLQGDSVELLVQMLSQASYIGEVENAVYIKEASLESAALLNSKIQHCMDNMYSVYRGTCPRVIMKLDFDKYLELKMYDTIATSNNFKVYYLGYWNSTEGEFVYGTKVIFPEEEDVVLIGLIAKEYVDKEWEKSKGSIYVECEESDLSEDRYITIDSNMMMSVTRNFDDHLLNDKIFDLTITDFGSRLYFPESLLESTSTISARYFKRTVLDDYNSSELKKIAVSGASLSSFSSDWISSNGFDDEVATGLIFIDSSGRDSTGTIHYKASRDRFTSSIIRSNSDVGTILEESYPEKVVNGGTTYEVVSGDGDKSTVLYIYYVPDNESNLLTDSEIEKFVNTKKAYYVTDKIVVKKGYYKTVVINLDVNVYQNLSIDSEVKTIFSDYEKKFGVDFTSSETMDEIRILIGKISNVASINNLTATIQGSVEDKEKTYYSINTIIHTKLLE